MSQTLAVEDTVTEQEDIQQGKDYHLDPQLEDADFPVVRGDIDEQHSDQSVSCFVVSIGCIARRLGVVVCFLCIKSK